MLYFIYDQLRERELDYLWDDPVRLTGLLILFPLIPLFKVLSWYELTKGLGIELSLKKTFEACYYSIAGRYIPGKVLFVVGRVTPYGPDKSKLLLATMAMMIEFLLEIVVALVLVMMSLSIYMFEYGYHTGLFSLSLFLVCVCCIFTYPKVLNAFVKVGLKLIKKEGEVPILKLKYILRSSFLIFFHWVVYLASIKILCDGIIPLPWLSMPSVGASFGGSALIGTLAVFSPGGLGVREVFAMEFFAQMNFLDREQGLLLASLSRLTQWIGEVSSFCIFAIWVFFSRNKK